MTKSIQAKIQQACKEVGMKEPFFYKKTSHIGGQDTFYIDIDNRQKLKIYLSDNNAVQVTTDTKKRQFLIKLTEPKRTVKFNAQLITRETGEIMPTALRREESIKAIKLHLIHAQKLLNKKVQEFTEAEIGTVIHPNQDYELYTLLEYIQGPTVDISAITSMTVVDKESTPQHIKEKTVPVKLSLNKSAAYFLIGYDCLDSKQPFISCVSMDADLKLKSVQDAHDHLRPKGVPDDPALYERQGEWFFVPVKDKALAIKLETEYCSDFYHTERFYEEDCHGELALNQWEANPTHNVTCLMTEKEGDNPKCYARGIVSDDRGSVRHAPLVLASWHQVFRNTELEATGQGWD